MPTFAFTSDVHLSFYPKDALPIVRWPSSVDALLLAGDIMDGVEPYAIEHVLRMSEGIPTFFTPGNHELYGMRRDKAIRELRSGFSGTHIQVLLNESISFQGVRIAGTDLWTDFDLLGDKRRSMSEAERSMNDYRQIQSEETTAECPDCRNIRPQDSVQWHDEARDFIRTTLENAEEPVVLMTHHAPSEKSIPTGYRGHRLSPCYASNLNRLYAGATKPPIVNVHGHIHRAQAYQMECGTYVLANPMGYHDRGESTGFDARRTFSVYADGTCLIGR